MSRQGPTLRLLVVCDECAHLYCKDALGKRNPYAARCQALHGKNGEGDRHIIAGHFPIIAPDWCPLRAKADEGAAVMRDELERRMPGGLTDAPKPEYRREYAVTFNEAGISDERDDLEHIALRTGRR